MASYDSDDSLDDEQDYTETDVLLGYASKESNGETVSRLGGRPVRYLPPNFVLSFFMRLIPWLKSQQEWIESSQPPSFAHAKCKICHAPLVLLLQLNGDLPERFPGHERRLYVFSCKNKGCRRKESSIRALRASRVSAEAIKKDRERKEKEASDKAEADRKEKERKEKEGKLGEAVFGVTGNPFAKSPGGGNANPFSTGGGGATSAAANPFAKPVPTPASAATTQPKATDQDETAKDDLPRTFAETLSLNNTQKTVTIGPPSPLEPWPADSELPAAYPVSYLSEAEYETLDPLPPIPQAISTTTGTMDMDEASGSSGGGSGKEDKDVFESTIDSTFQKFADRLSQNPDQCIRYEFSGQPLLYSKTDAVGKTLHDVPASSISKVLPRCGKCGAGRVFEVQLTPQAIVELEEGDEADGAAGLNLEGMDWGTVIVGVCERDCCVGVDSGETAYVEEWVGVQWEELTARR